MFTGSEIVEVLEDLGITHVIWIPDSTTGPWEPALEASTKLKLIRVCREGEAWPLAAGLFLGGQRPLVLMQTTGLFESGDALRNVLLDMQLPLLAIIGYRSYLVENSTDSARKFTEPILHAWGLDYVILSGPEPLGQLRDHFVACQAAGRPALALLPEGR